MLTEAAHGRRKRRVITISDEAIFELLDDADIIVLKSYSENGMGVTRTARNTHYDRRTISGRLTNIRLKVGIDPRDFFGLANLLRIIDEQGG